VLELLRKAENGFFTKANVNGENQLEHIQETFDKQFSSPEFHEALTAQGKLVWGEPPAYEGPTRTFHHWYKDDFGQWYRGERDTAPQYKWEETIPPKKEDDNPYRLGPQKDPPPYTKYRKPGLFDGRGVFLIPDRYAIIGWWKEGKGHGPALTVF